MSRPPAGVVARDGTDWAVVRKSARQPEFDAIASTLSADLKPSSAELLWIIDSSSIRNAEQTGHLGPDPEPNA